jgi:hypothetical protein
VALARGLVVRLSGLPAGARPQVRALAGRRVVASARARADRGGRATVRLRFTAAARRSLRGAARARLTVRAGGLATRVTLTRAARTARTAAAHATAAPAERYRSARFRVELVGVQRTRWSVERSSTEGCDLRTSGAGGETVRFRARPTTLSARWIGPTRLLFRGRALATLDLTAAIARQGSLRSGGEECSDGDGGGTPPAPDCGTKKGRMTVDLGWPVRRSDLIAIRPDLDVPFDPFRACPAGGLSWPQLLDSQPGSGRLVGAELPIADLFRHGKNIVIARDRAVTDEAGEKATTTIRWELSFTRLR